MSASVAGGMLTLAAVYAELAAAVLVSAARVEPPALLRHAGPGARARRPALDLVVEAAVHALDLVR